MRPLRAVIDKRVRFWNLAPFSIGEGSRSAAWAEQGRRKHGLAGGAISANASKGWRSARPGVSLSPTSVSPSAFASCASVERVEHHAFGPFMIRVDPDVDLLIERNAALCDDRCGEAPVRGKKRREKKASYPPEILLQRHGRAPQRA